MRPTALPGTAMMSAEEEALVMEAGETSAGGPPAPVAVSHTHTAAQPGKSAPDAEDERPICPNQLLDIDRLLTKPDGRPTLAFKLLLLSSLPLPIMFCSTGTFLFPAVHGMWKGGDLREVVCGIGFVLLILSQPLNMFVVRRVCRPQLLASIGIGRESEATDIRVRLLERALMNVNRGQGVGVTVLGTVIDKRRLTQLAAGMGAVVATVASVLYSYQPPERNSAAVETADAGFNVTWCVPGCVAR